ncbi:hypothetical protein [Paracidobacterium acidisoli]|uniref:Uncharacterized protein n=1 Tax=Paracidobacterium acidisoli TaxID=2303751 RepID=A0A372IT49_9BACT|nr:hypothetical protein [Paracidobacterium acidisoli]MBT9330503.1 hypothetical protein [Paracidobacterium acidisoli]
MADLRTAGAPVRGTQSFVAILGECRRRPSLLALELLWRWLFGIPMLALLAWEALRIHAAAAPQLAGTGIYQFSLEDPMRAAVVIADTWAVLWPPVLHVLLWLVPLGIAAWAVISGVGRNLVLRRYDRTMPWRPGQMIALQLIRMLAFAGSVIGWFAAIHWSAQSTLSGAEPNLVSYSVLVILFSLGIFTLWALLSWVFSIAPLLALLEDRGVAASLARSLRLGPLTGKLVEINLVMGIVKLGLVVLAMVFSAIPLPFETVMHGTALYLWWLAGSILYLIASDFFQVARLVAFIRLWGLAVQADAPAAQSRRS